VAAELYEIVLQIKAKFYAHSLRKRPPLIYLIQIGQEKEASLHNQAIHKVQRVFNFSLKYICIYFQLCGAHPASYPMGTRGSIHRSKAGGA
jgi:hypothetical protein